MKPSFDCSTPCTDGKKVSKNGLLVERLIDHCPARLTIKKVKQKSDWPPKFSSKNPQNIIRFRSPTVLKHVKASFSFSISRIRRLLARLPFVFKGSSFARDKTSRKKFGRMYNS